MLTLLHSSARLWAQTVTSRPRDFGSEARALLTLGSHIDQSTAAAATRASLALRKALARRFTGERLDVMVLPTTPCTAPVRNSATVDLVDGRPEPVTAALSRLTALAPVTGVPALSIPCGTDVAGMPVGLQILGPPHSEALLGRVAAAIDMNPAARGLPRVTGA